MAQKIIGIKLEVDAEQGKKIGLVFQQAEKSADGLANRTKNLQAIEQERVKIITQQGDAFTKLYSTISKVNQAYENNSKGANLGYGNATRALEGYQRTIERTTAALDELKRKQTSLALQNNFGLKEQVQSTPAKAPAVNYSYATGAYKDKEAEYRRYMLSMEEMAHAENEKYKKGLEAKKFADQAYINSAKVMYAQMFDEIAAKEAEASRRAKPVDARTVNAIGQNPYASYNTATGAKSFKPVDTFDPQAEAAKVRAAVEYENTLRDAGRNKQLIAQAKHAKDTLAIEQKLAKDIELVRQRVSGGFITKGQGFEEQRKAVEAYGKALKALPSLNPHIAEHKNLLVHIGEIIGAYRVLNFTINTALEALKNIPRAGIAQQQTQASVFAIFGIEEGQKNLQFLQNLAQSAGQYIGDLEQSYRTFAPSAVLAGAKQAEVNKIFKDFSEVSTVLHLSTDQVKSLYLALEQMYAKTTVQSEEIKKQLGNTLPGAVEIGAKAWASYAKQADTSVSAFMAAMKKNLVVTKDFAPAFAAEYRKIFGGVDDSVFNDVRTKLQSNLQRMRSEYENFSRSIFSATEGIMNETVKLAAGALQTVRENLEGIGQALKVIAVLGVAKAIQGIGAFAAGSLIGTLKKSTAEGIVEVSKFSFALETVGEKLRLLGPVVSTVFNPLTATIAAISAGATLVATSLTDMEVKYGKLNHASEEQVKAQMEIYAAQQESADGAGALLQAMTQVEEKSNSLFISFKGTSIELSTIFKVLGDYLAQAMEKNLQFLKGIKDNVVTAYTSITTGISQIGSSIVSYIQNLASSALEKVLEYIAKVKAAFVATAEFIGNGFNVKDFSTTYNTTLTESLSNNKKLVQDIGDSVGKVTDRVKGLGTSVVEGVSSGFGFISDNLKTTTETILRKAAQEQNKIDAALQEQQRKRVELNKGLDNKPENDMTGLGVKGKASSKADEALRKQEDQAAKVLELEKRLIAEQNAMEQDYYRNHIDAIKFMYDSDYISFKQYIDQKGAIEEVANTKTLLAIDEEIERVKKKLEIYSQVPQIIKDAQGMLDGIAKGNATLNFGSDEKNNQAIAEARELVDNYNNSLKGTNTRLDEVKKTELELTQLGRQKAQLQNQIASQTAQNAQDTKVQNKEIEESLAVTKQAYLEQLGVINEIAIRKAVEAKYAGEIADLAKIGIGDPNYAAAQQRLTQIEQQKEIDVAGKLSEMRRKQTQELRDISSAYKDVAYSANDAINSQLGGFGALINAINNFGAKDNDYAKARQENEDRYTAAVERRKNIVESIQIPLDYDKGQKEAFENADKAAKASALTRTQIDMDETASKIGNMRQIAGVSKAFFAENTKARRALHNAEMTLGAAEMAFKLGSLAIEGAKAILVQGQGEPYSAFARIAAMTALVAGIIAGVGGAMTKTGTSNVSMPVSDSKGTTFGAPDQEATDLTDTLSFLADVNYKSYRELRKLNENFAGISNDIYRLTLLQASGKALLPVRPTLEGTFPGTNILNTLKSPDPFQNIIQKNSANKMNKDLITGVLMRALMGSTTIKVIDEGIITARTTIASLLRGEQVLVQQYATIEATKKSLFGKSTEIFDSLSRSSNGASTIVTSLYTNIAKSVINLARNVSEVELNKAFNYVIPELKVSLQGKNTAEIQKTLQGVISKQLNLMSLKVFSVFKDLRQLKEGMFSTVSRIFAEREIVETSFKDIGVTSLPTANIEAIKFSDAMIQLSATTGTAVEKIKAFQQAESDFYKNFVSKNQQNLDTVTKVAEGLFSVFEKGLSKTQQAVVDQEVKVAQARAKLAQVAETSNATSTVYENARREVYNETNILDTLRPQSKSLRDYFQEAFASTGNFGDALILVKRQLDLATDSGKETYSLINDLNDITSKYNDLTKELYDSIDKQVTTLRDSIDLRTQDQLLAALRASRDINEQKELSTKIQKLMLDKHNAEISSIKTITSAYKALGDLVKNMLLGDLSTLGPKAKLDEARSQYERTLATAQGPDKVAAAEAAQKLGSIAQAYLQQAKTYYSSTTAYASIFASVTATLKALADSVPDTTTETTVTQAVIDSTNATIAALDTLRKAVTEALSETLKVEITNVQDSVEQDTPKGVGTLEALFNKLATADKGEKALLNKQIAAYNAGYKKSGTTGAELALAAEQERQAAKATLKGKEGEYNLAKKNKDKALMATLALDIAEAKAIIAAKTAVLRTVGFKASGGDAFGPTVVGERGIEFLNLPRGSSVSSNAQTNSIIAMANKQVIAELQGMNKELRSLNDRMGDIERKSRLSKSERTLV